MPNKFDPTGSGYDEAQAKTLGFKRNREGHLPSRNPITGQILKGIKHPTFDKAIEEDLRLGFLPYIDQLTGNIHTFKINPDPSRFTPFEFNDPAKILFPEQN